MNNLNPQKPQREMTLFKFFAQIYLNVGYGIAIAAMSAWLVSDPRILMAMISGPVRLILLFSMIGAIFYMKTNILSMGALEARLWYFLITALNGLILAPISIIYTGQSIVMILVMTALVFIVASQYGLYTGEDLTAAAGVARVILLGASMVLFIPLILSMIGLINFYTISMLHWGFCLLIAIFVPVCIAGTSQQLAQIYHENKSQHIAIIGALQLFLNFVDLFLAFLRLFGKRRDE